MPQVNPTDGTSVVDDVVVIGTKRLDGYLVVPPFPADDNSGPLPSETPEAPEHAKVLVFENDAAEGDRGSEISAIQCPGARLS